MSLVIPALDAEERLPRTLASVAAQLVTGRVEVVVVDDGSKDATGDAAARAALPWGPAVVVRHEAPKGRAGACNSGITAARGPVVVILDDDMDLEPGALEAHRAFHEAHPGRAAIGKVVQTPYEPPTIFTRFLVREEENRDRQLLAGGDDVPFPLCMTGHFSAPRRALVEAGLFDARITRYGLEDIELGFRLGQRGVRIAYLPAAVSVHRAFMTSLDRYVRRHFDVGVVARELAARYTEGPFRDFLRVDGPAPAPPGGVSAGLAALRWSNRMLLVGPLRRALGSRPGLGASRLLLRAAEALHWERAAHFGYHVVRDLAYFQGYFGEGRAARREKTA